MKSRKFVVFGAILILFTLAGCLNQANPQPTVVAPTSVPAPTTAVATSAPADSTDAAAVASADPNQLAIKAFTKGGCIGCHIIPGVKGASGTIGPDLTNIGEKAAQTLKDSAYTGKAKTVDEFLHEAIMEPDIFIAKDCGGSACQKGIMPPSLGKSLSPEELTAVIAYLQNPVEQTTAAAPVTNTEVVTPTSATALLNDEDFAWAKGVYFQRCAGCHATLRKGATGPALTPDTTIPKGTVALSTIIFNGTSRGMPDWGKQGFFTEAQTEVMAKFLQMEPPVPPEFSLEGMKASWKELVPVAERPTSPQTKRNWENYFVVTLRDAGQVAVIDGDNYDVISNVDTGYAVHITRMSATGRYAYVIGRDGKLALVDLWTEIPTKVAEVQVCYDARSVEVSKYNGPEGDFTDKLAIVGCYWPPHFVIMDGQTLEPKTIVSTRGYTVDTKEYHPEPRVASIVSSEYHPEWIVNVKETGQIWLVNYVDIEAPQIKMLPAARFLHDGGWDSTHRYFMVAANQSNKVGVVDAKEGKMVALVDTPKIPHPGRGANWIDPEFGPVWSSAHLGDPAIVSIGTDPEGHPDAAWKSVRVTELPGSGSLFIKTHPKSQWIWVDMTLNADPVLSRTICVVAKSDPTKTHKCWEASSYGRAVHFEYNKDGTEIWVSIWGDASKAGETGEIVVYDDATLTEKTRIKNLITPTGKFNVFNTVEDIY